MIASSGIPRDRIHKNKNKGMFGWLPMTAKAAAMLLVETSLKDPVMTVMVMLTRRAVDRRQLDTAADNCRGQLDTAAAPRPFISFTSWVCTRSQDPPSGLP